MYVPAPHAQSPLALAPIEIVSSTPQLSLPLAQQIVKQIASRP